MDNGRLAARASDGDDGWNAEMAKFGAPSGDTLGQLKRQMRREGEA